MEIVLIQNLITNKSVCPQYLHKKLNMSKTEFIVGKPLKVVYEKGSFFTHENVVSVKYPDDNTIYIKTTNKVWIIKNTGVFYMKKELYFCDKCDKEIKQHEVTTKEIPLIQDLYVTGGKGNTK